MRHAGRLKLAQITQQRARRSYSCPITVFDAERLERAHLETLYELVAAKRWIKFPTFPFSDHGRFFSYRPSTRARETLAARYDHFSWRESRQRGLQIVDLDGSQSELTGRQVRRGNSYRIAITTQRA